MSQKIPSEEAPDEAVQNTAVGATVLPKSHVHAATNGACSVPSLQWRLLKYPPAKEVFTEPELQENACIHED